MNETLNFIKEIYPDYLRYVPSEYYNLPVLPKYLALTTAAAFFVLMCISMGANSLMVLVFFRLVSLSLAFWDGDRFGQSVKNIILKFVILCVIKTDPKLFSSST